MNETELKVLNIDIDQTIKKLVNLGASVIFEGEVITSYYDYPGNELTKSGAIVRLRKFGERAEIAFKRNVTRNKFMVNEEIQTSIGDINKMHQILLTLGFIRGFTSAKYRYHFETETLKFYIDKYSQVPAYLEIEGNINNITKAIEDLDLEKNQTTSMAAVEILSRIYGMRV